MDFKNDSIIEFTNKLASNSPVPGGGGAAALTAALSSALSSMVFNLTVGKKVFENFNKEIKQEVTDALEMCSFETQRFLQYINKDGEAFLTLMDAYKLPKTEDDEKAVRESAIQKGLHSSMMVPYKLAVDMVKFMDTIAIAAEYGNQNVISDAGVAAILAHSTVESCVLNVMVNVKFIKEDTESVVENCRGLMEKAEILKSKIMETVYKRI